MKGWLEWYCWKMNDPVWALTIASEKPNRCDIVNQSWNYNRTISMNPFSSQIEQYVSSAIESYFIQVTHRNVYLQTFLSQGRRENHGGRQLKSNWFHIEIWLAKLENWVGSCWAVIRVIMNHFIIHSKLIRVWDTRSKFVQTQQLDAEGLLNSSNCACWVVWMILIFYQAKFQ